MEKFLIEGSFLILIPKRLFLSPKKILAAVILSLLFLILSPHLYIKHNWFENKFSTPYQDRIETYFNCDNINCVKLVENSNDIIPAAYIAHWSPKYKYNLTAKLTVPAFEHLFSFDIKADKKAIVEVKLDRKEFYKSFKINGVDYLKDFSNSNLITFSVSKKSPLHFEITTEQIIKKSEKLLDNISYFALLTSFFLYFLLFLFLSHKISSPKIDALKTFFVKHKIETIIFSIFLLFYLVQNIYFVCNVNQFLWGASLGDTPYILPQIMHNLTKRFHPYYFLPFYPVFDILLLLTKNVLLSLGIIYCVIAAFSVVFVFKALKLITKLRFAVILASIFGTAWAQLQLSSSFDLYIITGFYLSILVYLTIKELKFKNYNFKNMFLIVLICALTCGVTVPNIITGLILMLPIFIIKKNWKIITVCLILIAMFVAFFTQFKGLTCDNQSWQNLFHKNTANEAKLWVKNDLIYNWKKFNYSTLREPVIHKNYPLQIAFDLFLFLSFVLSIFCIKNLPKNNKNRQKLLIYLFTVIALIYNFIANFFWYPTTGILFSLNHLALWFIIFGFALNNINECMVLKDKRKVSRLICLVLIALFIAILYTNCRKNFEFKKERLKTYPMTYNVLDVK